MHATMPVWLTGIIIMTVAIVILPLCLLLLAIVVVIVLCLPVASRKTLNIYCLQYWLAALLLASAFTQSLNPKAKLERPPHHFDQNQKTKKKTNE